MNAESEKRDSRALEPELITDPIEKARAEARNGLRQYDYGVQVIQTALERSSFKLRPSLILGLHREALAGISVFAGNYRPAGVEIQGSKHEPVGAHLVPEMIEEMCDYVNEHWQDSTPIHLAAYVMWRLNWIHPFADGNGRTARTLSLVVLAISSGGLPPGTPTVPDQIVSNRTPYFEALDAADEVFKNGKIDVSKMEELIDALVANQLANYYETIRGKVPD